MFHLKLSLRLGALFLASPLFASPLSIELCEAPLLLHLRPHASEFESLEPESLGLCGESALTEYLPIPGAEDTVQTLIFARGMKLQLTRSEHGMRVQLRLGQSDAEALVLESNAPERALRWETPGENLPKPSPMPPALLARVERRPPGTGLSQQFKVYTLN